jgi:ubiquinone/menaquinone biosynthesis C-methylase UbiE
LTRITLPVVAAAPADGWESYWEEFDAAESFHREPSKLYVEKLVAAVPLRPKMRVLDFGCGFGFVAELLADHVSEVWVWDASANMRRRTQKLLERRNNCHLLDLANPVTAVSEPRFDLILVNSVIQYMTRHEFIAWLAEWQPRLMAGGRMVVSDIIPPALSSFTDLLDLLRFSRRRGLLYQTLQELCGGFISYSKQRTSRPLTRYDHEELARIGKETGLQVSFLANNLTHFSGRITASLNT